MESRSLRARTCSVILGLSLVAAGCGGGAEDAGPAVTVARTSTPPPTIATTTTTTEPTTTEEEEETTTTETPTTLEFADEETNTTKKPSSGKGAAPRRSSGGGSGENEGQFEGDQPPEDITNPTTTTTTTAPPSTDGGDTTAPRQTTTTLATTTTIDPFANFEGLDEYSIPHTDPDSLITSQFVNLQCNANGATPQVELTSPLDLLDAEQRVSFYGPSGAIYIASDTVIDGEVTTFSNWLTAPVVADSFDWVAICSQPSWKVLVEFSDDTGGFFSGVVDASISG